MNSSTPLPLAVTVAINDSALAMTARYNVLASGSADAAEQATANAHAEFGSGSLGLANGWTTERIEAV